MRNIFLATMVATITEPSFSNETEQRKGLKQVGRLVKKPGHKIWEYNPTDQSINEAQYDTAHQIIHSNNSRLKSTTINRLITKEGHLYCSALNKNNALKHFQKQLPI